MEFPAMKPSRTVHASSEQEAIYAALDSVRSEIMTATDVDVADSLEPILVVELEPGLWDVVFDTADELACDTPVLTFC